MFWIQFYPIIKAQIPSMAGTTGLECCREPGTGPQMVEGRRIYIWIVCASEITWGRVSIYLVIRTSCHVPPPVNCLHKTISLANRQQHPCLSHWRIIFVLRMSNGFTHTNNISDSRDFECPLYFLTHLV